MINGIDILFVAIALVLLLIVWEMWDQYSDWSEWNRDRRFERRRYRYELKDAIDEGRYRSDLRIIFRVRNTTNAMYWVSHSMTETAKAFANLNQALRSGEYFTEHLTENDSKYGGM